MSAITIENGQRVGQLLEVTKVDTSAYFLMDVNDLSRKISITSLRYAFSGDDATSNKSNLFYSCEKVDEFVENLSDNITRIRNDLENINKRMTEIYNTFGDDLASVRALIENYHTELVAADTTLDNKFTNITNNISERLTQEVYT